MRITGATWIDSEGSSRTEPLFVAHGRWVSSSHPSTETLHLPGALVFPGLIDAHVHFREPGLEYKEGIDNGTRAALAGGVTTVLEMPNTVPPCASPAALEQKRKLYRAKSRTNWGLHYQATREPQVPPDAPFASAKIYMAKSSTDEAIVEVSDLIRILSTFRRVSVHAEDESKFCPGMAPPVGHPPNRMHHIRRPKEAITEALSKLETALRAIPSGKRARLVLCHSTTKEEIDWLRRMKRSGFDVWGETCPHYLFLTQDDYVETGNDLKVNPPLRSRSDADAVLAGVAEGVIDFISTDHAPHSPEEKKRDDAPSGIASIECLLPLLLSLVSSKKLTMQRLVDATTMAPSRCYEMDGHGAIDTNNAASFVVLESNPWTPSRPVLTRAETHPYVGRTFAHRITQTFVNGVWAYRNGQWNDDARGMETIR